MASFSGPLNPWQRLGKIDVDQVESSKYKHSLIHDQHDLDYPYIFNLKILLRYDRKVEI